MEENKMFEEKEFNDFIKKMEAGVVENKRYYDDTWKREDVSMLEQRLVAKFTEFNMTKKPSKLVSLANLAMMVYIRNNSD
jgi:hypothetical protein